MCQRNFDSAPRKCPTDPYEGWLFSLHVRTLQCFWRYRHLSPDLVGNSHPISCKSQILFHYRCGCKDLQLHQVSHIYSCNNLYHCWRILWAPKWRRFLQTFRCRIKLHPKNPTGWWLQDLAGMREIWKTSHRRYNNHHKSYRMCHLQHCATSLLMSSERLSSHTGPTGRQCWTYLAKSVHINPWKMLEHVSSDVTLQSAE